MGAATGYDYIIVGAGSAGCVLANRLSADPARKVLVLEAGGPDRHFWLRLPVGYFKTIYDTRFSRLFPTEPSEGTNGRSIIWPRGRVLGGSSSINGLIYIRGQREDYGDWVRAGAEDWDYPLVLPYFKRSECYAGGADPFHGDRGELGVSQLKNDHPYCRAWLDAAQQFGLPYNPDFNAATDYGVGPYQLTIRNGLRVSAAGAFLHPVRQRPNLTVRTHAMVTRVLFEAGRAVGVEWLVDGQPHHARAELEVILAAGTIQTPQLLQLSGIGPGSWLHRLGIPVQVDAPEVGENLQDHYQARAIVRLKQRMSLNDDVRNPLKLASMGWQWLVKRSGPLTVGAGQVGGFACTEYAAGGRADIQFNVMPLSVDKPGDPLHRFSGFTVSACQCRPTSRGRIRIRSPDPFDSPCIEANYLATETDRKTLVAGLRMLREIYAQPAFRNLIAGEVWPGPEAQHEQELLNFARQTGGTVFHPTGTCRMGRDDDAVVDPELRVRGIDGLRIVDASVMPTLTSANTNAPTLMIAEKGADLILRN